MARAHSKDMVVGEGGRGPSVAGGRGNNCGSGAHARGDRHVGSDWVSGDGGVRNGSGHGPYEPVEWRQWDRGRGG